MGRQTHWLIAGRYRFRYNFINTNFLNFIYGFFAYLGLCTWPLSILMATIKFWVKLFHNTKTHQENMCCEINIRTHGFVLGIHSTNSLLVIYPLVHSLRTDKCTKSILDLFTGSLSSVCSFQYPQGRGLEELFILTVVFLQINICYPLFQVLVDFLH